MTKQVAVVAGASGVVGRGLTEALAADPDWQVIALARKEAGNTARRRQDNQRARHRND